MYPADIVLVTTAAAAAAQTSFLLPERKNKSDSYYPDRN